MAIWRECPLLLVGNYVTMLLKVKIVNQWYSPMGIGNHTFFSITIKMAS